MALLHKELQFARAEGGAAGSPQDSGSRPTDEVVVADVSPTEARAAPARPPTPAAPVSTLMEQAFHKYSKASPLPASKPGESVSTVFQVAILTLFIPL